MSGHSKWATIKRKKGSQDIKRGKLFSKLSKEISVSVKQGGGQDPDSNSRLKTAIENAKNYSMPKDNIERAIKRASGEGSDALNFIESTYEGYGPSGIAILVEVLTENKNRTTSEIRHIFTKYNGNLGELGCVSWIFSKKGVISIEKKDAKEEELYNIVLESGAEDLKEDESFYEIICDPIKFFDLKKELDKNNIKFSNAEITMFPTNTVKLTGNDAQSVIKLVEALEDLDDVQRVHSNFDISEDELEKINDLNKLPQ